MNHAIIEPLETRIAPASLTISGTDIQEGNSGTQQLIFTVIVSPPDSAVTVDFTTQDGADPNPLNNATVADGDYDFTSGTLTFQPGDTSKTIAVTIHGDTKFEHDEIFSVVLSNVVGADINIGTSTVAIRNDDTLPKVSIGATSVLEGNDPNTQNQLLFPVQLSNPSSDTVSVTVSTQDGTATLGDNDYVATTTVVTFLPGETMKTFSVPVIGDTKSEADETVFANLSGVSSGATIDTTKAQGTGTILSDDQYVTIDDAQLIEGNSGTANMSFPVRVHLGPANQEVTVDYATQDGTAISVGANADYQAVNGTLKLMTDANGDATGAILVPVKGDLTPESDETFTVKLSNASNGIIVTKNTATGTILNDDPSLIVSPATLTEGDLGDTATMTFTVTLDKAAPNTTYTFDYHTADGTAVSTGTTKTGTRDYEPTSGTKTITTDASGHQQTTFDVTINGDGVTENSEFFNAILTNLQINSAGPQIAIQTDTAKGTIVDNDTTVLTIGDATVVEGDSGTKNAIFLVTLTPASQGTVTVNYGTFDGTANQSGPQPDFTPKNGTLTFAPGVTVQTVIVPILGDLIHEGDETFTVKLTSPSSGASIANDIGTGTIVDNDPLPTISLTPVSVAEGDVGGTSKLTFTATLSAPSQDAVTVDFATLDGTATVADNDYTANNGTLTFAPGVVTQTITIDVIGDSKNEADETMSVQLSNPSSNATLVPATASATGTILNDDIVATVAPATFDEGAGTVTMTVTLSQAPVDGATATVDFMLNGGTATLGTDFKLHDPSMTSLVFNAGETTKTIALDIIDDTLSEAAETFAIKLTGATGAVIQAGNDTGTGTITDNDPLQKLSIKDAQITEGDSGTSNMTFTVTLDAPSGQTVTAQVATVAGTAIADVSDPMNPIHGDFLALPDNTTITFAPGETSKTITVPIIGDTIDEQTETFKVQLSGATGATILRAEATGTIFDNDLRAVSITDASGAEGAAGEHTPMTFTVSIPNAAAQDITVHYDTFDGTAKAGTDYDAVTDGMVTIPAGKTSVTFQIEALGNNTPNPDKSFIVKLRDPVNATLADFNAIGTITDDESSYKLAPATAGSDTSVEDDPNSATPKTVSFKVTRSGDTTLPGTVSFTTVNGSALGGADFLTQSGTLNFAPGQTEKTITVTLRKDVAHENTETFDVKLTGSTGGVLKDGNNAVQPALTATATILDNDPTLPTLTVSNASAPEGNPGDSGSTDLTFVVSLSAADEVNDVTVTYETMDGTAISTSDATRPADYNGVGPTTLTIPKGSLSASFVVHVLRDTINEADETFSVLFSNPTGGETFTGGAATTTATGTIKNDDAVPTITFDGANNGNLTVVEGSSGTAPATFTVKLSAASEQTVTVDVSTIAGTATLGTDPTLGADFSDAGVPATLTFAPGETVKTFDYQVLGDTRSEPDETFTVKLSNAVNASLGANATLKATATIKNDDPVPVLVIQNASVLEGNSGTTTNLVFDVSLSGESDQAVTVDYTTLDIGAVSSGPGQDYQAVSGTLTFAPGEHSKTISVPVIGDDFKEGDETLEVKLSNPTNSIIAPALGNGIGTILEDGDTKIGVTITDVKVVEGDSGTKNATFTVALSGASTVPVTVDVATRNGTATAGSDYTANQQTLSFAPGQTLKSFSVAIQGDTVFEATESYFVDVKNPTGGAVIIDGEGRGTIFNDDVQMVNGQTVRFVDADGDLATVQISKGKLTLSGQRPVLVFKPLDASGTVVNDIGGRTLEMIDFTSNRVVFNHTNLSVTADAQPGFAASGGKSDGRVDVGYIQGGIPQGSLFQIFDNIDFGNIRIEGDLGKIIAGDQIATDVAVQSLNILSHGAKGSGDTGTTGAPDNNSVLLGGAGRVVIGGDCFGVIESVGGDFGNIQSLSIKGALRGDSTDGSGQIFVTGTLVSAKIGSIVGGAGNASGTIVGNFTTDATVSTGSHLGTIQVVGDIVGGAGTNSGRIFAPTIKAVTVGGNLSGGTGASSGVIQSGISGFGGTLGSVTVKGNVVGGAGANSGEIFAAKTIGSAVVRGSFLGGAGQDSGSIVSNASINTVTILQNLEGGSGTRSGSVQTTKSLGGFRLGASGSTVNGDLIGGEGNNSGTLLIGGDVHTAVVIAGSIEGGNGTSSGGVNVVGTLAQLSIGRDLIGGTTDPAASDNPVTAINISGYIAASRIGTLTVGGDITSGTKVGSGSTVAGSATIRSSGDIGSLTVGGDIVGNADVPVVIAAKGGGAAGNQTIRGLVVKGNTAYADILGGYGGGVTAANPLGDAVNPDAQMGTIRLLGAVQATNIVAGVESGDDGKFGTVDDQVIHHHDGDTFTVLADNPSIQSRIAAVVIKAPATNTDTYGVVAQLIAAATVAGAPVALDPLKSDTQELGSGSNFFLREIPRG